MRYPYLGVLVIACSIGCQVQNLPPAEPDVLGQATGDIVTDAGTYDASPDAAGETDGSPNVDGADVDVSDGSSLDIGSLGDAGPDATNPDTTSLDTTSLDTTSLDTNSADLGPEGKCAVSPNLCNDGDPCTLDACAPESGACSHSAAATGTVCDKSLCNWAVCTGSGKCDGYGSVVAPAGTACKLASGKSGLCSGELSGLDYGCSECLTAMDCPVNPAWNPWCYEMKCTGGMCDFYNYNAGQSCNLTNECMTGAGMCSMDYQCDGTPVADGTKCAGGVCKSGNCVP